MPIDTQGDRLENGRCADKSFSYRRRNMIGCCFEVEGKINYGIVEGDRFPIPPMLAPHLRISVTDSAHLSELERP